MKLALFTPVLKRSAIGRAVRLVTRSLLEEGHEVTIVRAEAEEYLQADMHSFEAPVIPWNDPAVPELLSSWPDAIVYNVGDNFTYHQGCLEWMPSMPGIVCLHDYFLGHLFYAWSVNHWREAELLLRRWYGDAVANEYFDFSSSEEFVWRTWRTAPMTEWVCSMASAVITHSGWRIDRVLASCPGPVSVVPLPYDAPALSTARSSVKSEARFNILTIGHINNNKRADAVIRAIGGSQVLKEKVSYRLAGAIEPDMEVRLTKLARELGVGLIVSGHVDDVELADAIQAADIICCLRWPTLEAASASAIEALLYGKPLVVADAGFYSEIPDSCVKKVRPQHELADLKGVLEGLYQDDDLRCRIASEGKNWAISTFSATQYAKELCDIVPSANVASEFIRSAEFFSQILKNWKAAELHYTLPDTLEPLQLFARICRHN